MGKKIDLTNKKIGRLTVLYDTGERKNGKVVWYCKCECGTEKTFISTDLTSGKVQSCGCYHREICKKLGLKNKNRVSKSISNEIGKQHGWLTVLEPAPSKNKRAYWKCKCVCGNTAIVMGKYLRNGDTKRCGCIKSSGEQKISDLLIKSNLFFEKEKKFETCVFPDTHALARFDFFVNNQYIIEYDGEQHFQSSNKYYSEERVIKDIYKNNWCKQNNIPIIRIPYTHYNDLCIEDLMLDTSKFILNNYEDILGKKDSSTNQKTQNTSGTKKCLPNRKRPEDRKRQMTRKARKQSLIKNL